MKGSGLPTFDVCEMHVKHRSVASYAQHGTMQITAQEAVFNMLCTVFLWMRVVLLEICTEGKAGQTQSFAFQILHFSYTV